MVEERNTQRVDQNDQRNSERQQWDEETEYCCLMLNYLFFLRTFRFSSFVVASVQGLELGWCQQNSYRSDGNGRWVRASGTDVSATSQLRHITW